MAAGYVDAAAGDFPNITPSSPARGAGPPNPAAADLDLDGQARPRGALDVGADEIDQTRAPARPPDR